MRAEARGILMTVLDGAAPAHERGARSRTLAGLALAGLVAAGAVGWLRPGEAVPMLDVEAGGDAQAAAERYVLPITAPLDQGDTGLCWVFATLSMLETNYMSRHPGVHVEFSRAALQRHAIADRFRRLVRGEKGEPSEGGLPVEALALVRENGLVDRGDFQDVVNAAPLFAALEGTLAQSAEARRKEQEIENAVASTLGAPPPATHLEGQPVSPAALASAALGGEAWAEYDLSRDGSDGWGPSRDPDARPETRVRYVTLDKLIGLIRRSLARGEAAVVGTADHALLVYGADYDRSGKPLAYLVKDSFAPYLYRADPDDLHRRLNDVTVSFDGAQPQWAGDPAQTLSAGAGAL